MRLKLYAIVIVAVLCFNIIHHPSYAGDNKLPNIGSNALSTLSYEKERLLGDVLMRQTRAQLPVDYDPLINEYINSLGNKLVTYADDIHFPFTFFAIRDPSINAFAFFGGHVAINTGLIALSDNESELASVLSHEISHVTQRHLSRRMEDQKRSSPLTLAGLLGGILLAAINPEAGMAAIMTTQAGSAQASINFTRANEKEADRIGINMLAVAGFDPHAAPSFFNKLSKKYRFTSTPPAFLLTHPLPDSRVADSKLRAQRYPRPVLPISTGFQLVKSRVKARYGSKPEETIRYFKKQLKNKTYALKEAAEYGLALSYSDSGNTKEANKMITELLKGDPKNLFYIDTYTDILTRMKKYDEALAFLKQHYQMRPNNPVITINYASVAVSAKKPQLAIDLLNSYKISHGINYISTDILANAYQQMKNLSKYHELRAERFALLSLYDRSIEELNISLSKLDEGKRLESERLTALQEQYRSQLDQIKRL